MPRRTPQLAKLTRPRLASAIARERLFKLLDEARETRPAICVVGPPGSGKTTLVASWLGARNIKGIWYQVDPGDADLATFFHYLGLAVRAFTPKGQRALPALTPEYLQDVPGFTRRFARELFSRLPRPATLVLDNYQEVAPDQRLHEVVAITAEEAPRDVTVIVVSRADPPAHYARLLANGNVELIEWDDLKLTPEETRTVASTRRGIDGATAKILHERSGGWAAGLTLMLERARGGGAEPDAVDFKSREAVFDYFATQVFDQLSPSERRTLSHVAVLPTASAALAVALSGDDGAGVLLERLYRRHLFTDRRSAYEPRYQFHALFQEFLLRRLSGDTDESQRQQLYRQAARLLEDVGQREEAVEICLRCRDWDSAARLVRELAPGLLGQGRWKTIQGWIRALGDEAIADDPWLLYWLGKAQMQQDLRAARVTLARAFERLRGTHDSAGQMRAAAAVLQAIYFEYNDFTSMDAWVAALDELLEQGAHCLDASAELEIYSALLLAFTYRLPGHRRSEEVAERVTRLLDADLDVNQKISAGTALLIHHTLSMQVANAEPIISRVEPLLGLPEVTPLNQAYWWTLFGYNRYRSHGDLKGVAEEAFARAHRVSEEHGIRSTAFLSRIFRAYYCVGRMDLVGAAAAVQGLESWIVAERPMTSAQYHLAMCQLALGQEDGAGAAYHGRLATASACKLGAPFFSVVWCAQTAGALVMAGSFAEAEQGLDVAWRDSEGTFLNRYRSTIVLVRAYSALRQGDRARAHTLIRQMIPLARDHDSWSYLRAMATIKNVVLEEALAAGIDVPFVQMIVSNFQLRPRRLDIEAWPWPIRIYTLGSFRALKDGMPIEFPRKAQRKPLDLLKALIALGGRGVDAGALIDALWPGADGDDAQNALTMAVFRLRKLLGNERAIGVREGKYSLDPHLCWVDAWALDQLLKDVESRQELDDAALEPILTRLARLYQGQFLEHEVQQPWMLGTQERLRRRVQRAVLKLGAYLERSGRWDEAIGMYERGLQLDNLAEELYRRLMVCHRERGDHTQALAVYRRCRELLSVVLGMTPSSETQAVRETLRAA